MILDKEKKKLFDDAYNEYQRIKEYIYDFYFDAEGNEKEVSDLRVDINYNNAMILSNAYIQGTVIKIAASDGYMTEDEKVFIRSILDNPETLNCINGYRKFMRGLSAEAYNSLNQDFILRTVTDNVPIYIMLSVIKDKMYNTNDSALLLKSTEHIFECFIAIDDICSDEENQIFANQMDKIRQALQEENIELSIEHEEYDVEKSNQLRHRDDNKLEKLFSELNSLVGLSEVKSEVMATVNLIKVNNLRISKGLKAAPVSNHMVFLGNPGTGKTTVARLIAQIYKELGVVTKGHLIETDRSGLVAGYVGQTSIKTKEVVTKAIGGILFIDEAYSLTRSNDSNDYGNEAIDALVKLMEDNRDNLVVIVAGYTEEMKGFMAANPGLESRFNKRINFKDYSQEELLHIFMHICENAGFILSGGALERIAYILSECAVSKNFGNARGVRNLFDKAIINQANRIVNLDNADDAQLLTIEKEDIPTPESM